MVFASPSVSASSRLLTSLRLRPEGQPIHGDGPARGILRASAHLSISHLNLAMRDVPASRSFFCFRCPRPNDALSALVADDGLVLTLMTIRECEPASCPGSFHVGISTQEPEVERLHRQMAESGCQPGEISRIHRGTMFHATDPNVVIVEICSLDSGSSKRAGPGNTPGPARFK